MRGGPAPKANRRRANLDEQPRFNCELGPYAGPRIRWPLPEPPTPWQRRRFNDLAKLPQATIWVQAEQIPLLAIYVVTESRCAAPRAPVTGLLGLLGLQRELLLDVSSMAKLGIRIANATSTDPNAKPDASQPQPARRRLKAVDPDISAGQGLETG